MLVDFVDQAAPDSLEHYSLDLPMPPRKGEFVKLGARGAYGYYQVVGSLYMENVRYRDREGGAICYVQKVPEPFVEGQLEGIKVN